jgi:hypothetical protein
MKVVRVMMRRARLRVQTLQYQRMKVLFWMVASLLFAMIGPKNKIPARAVIVVALEIVVCGCCSIKR